VPLTSEGHNSSPAFRGIIWKWVWSQNGPRKVSAWDIWSTWSY